MNKKGSFSVVIIVCAFFVSCERDARQPTYIQGNGLIDAEGNEYETVIIGDQEWMAENLKTDLYCNGDSIPYSGDDVRVKVYDNDPENEAVFGKLYNFQAVLDTAGLCPCGWHIPTELEYAILIDYLGGYEKAMKRLKSMGSLEKYNGLWSNPESDYVLDGNNVSGFNAIPAGIGFYNGYLYQDSLVRFWSLPTEGLDAVEFSIYIGLRYVDKQRNTLVQAKQFLYYSIRCIKDL
jgi:uncharacterized protein (TIGR02145 family)